MEPFYHLIDRDEWEREQSGEGYAPASVAKEGFIHCSYPYQLLRTANHHFAGRDNLVLLRIDPSRVRAEVRHDPVNVVVDGAPAVWDFPHIYGPLNPDAVVGMIDFPRGSDGRFTMPQELASP